jgi:hypothetical protein
MFKLIFLALEGGGGHTISSTKKLYFMHIAKVVALPFPLA